MLELQKPGNEEDKTLRGFLLELYAYLALVGNIKLGSEAGYRAVDLDPFLFSLGSLSEYPTFGFMFGCAYELFELIPTVCQFGRQRILEEKRGQSPSLLVGEYETPQERIRTWQPPAQLEFGTEQTEQLITAARIYQHGLLIFLRSAFYLSNIDGPVFIIEVESSSDQMFEFINKLSSKHRVLSFGI